MNKVGVYRTTVYMQQKWGWSYISADFSEIHKSLESRNTVHRRILQHWLHDSSTRAHTDSTTKQSVTNSRRKWSTATKLISKPNMHGLSIQPHQSFCIYCAASTVMWAKQFCYRYLGLDFKTKTWTKCLAANKSSKKRRVKAVRHPLSAQ